MPNDDALAAAKFNTKGGCLGMLGVMIAVCLLAWGLVYMIGLDPEKSLRATGFIMFVTGSAGLLSFFVFATHADTIAKFIRQIKKK